MSHFYWREQGTQRKHSPTVEALFSCLRVFSTISNGRSRLSESSEGHGYPAGPVSHLQALCGCFAFKMVVDGCA